MRVKRGKTKKKKHKKLLKQAKGYRLTYSKLYRRAQEAVLHAGQYNYAHRRRRRSNMRNEWIQTISAALSDTDLTYSKFIHGLKENNIAIDRKNLAYMAINHPEDFKTIVAEVK